MDRCYNNEACACAWDVRKPAQLKQPRRKPESKNSASSIRLTSVASAVRLRVEDRSITRTAIYAALSIQEELLQSQSIDTINTGIMNASYQISLYRWSASNRSRAPYPAPANLLLAPADSLKQATLPEHFLLLGRQTDVSSPIER